MSLDYESLRLPSGVDPLDAGSERMDKDNPRRKQALSSRQLTNYHRRPVQPYIKTAARSIVEDDAKQLNATINEMLFNGDDDALARRLRLSQAYQILVTPIPRAIKLFCTMPGNAGVTPHERASHYNGLSKQAVEHVNEQAADDRYPSLFARLGAVSVQSTKRGVKLIVCDVSDATGVLKRDNNEYLSIVEGSSVNEEWSGNAMVIGTAKTYDVAQSVASVLDESRALEGMYLSLDRCVEKQFVLPKP